MGRKSKYSKELKLSIVKRYLNGEGSTYTLAREINSVASIVLRWIKKYQVLGESAFDIHDTNASYTREFKQQVVLAYLNKEGTFDDLAIKYNISSNTTIQKWVQDYNSHIQLKDYIPGGEDIYMAKSRKVNKEERIEIVNYCLEHDMDYKTTAKIFETTYANVFNWVRKYREKGKEVIIGIENQSTVDRNMAIRILVYDALKYDRQLKKQQERQKKDSSCLYNCSLQWR